MSSVSRASDPELPGWEGIIRPAIDLFGICLEKDKLARCCPLDKVPSDAEYPVSSTLGKLDTLPLELEHAVFLCLDVQSLMNLRRVSQKGRLSVDSLPQYRIVQEHAPELLRAAIGLQTSEFTLIADLFKALTCQTCYLCGDFGPFIYLLSCNRVCYLCMAKNTELRPLRVSHARNLYTLDKHVLGSLPKLRSLPGDYSRHNNTCKKQIHLVDRVAAARAGIAVHGSAEDVKKAFKKYKTEALTKYSQRFQRYTEKKSSNPTLHSPVFPWLSEGHDGEDRNTHRFMGIIRVPWVDLVSGRKERGVLCQGCERGAGIGNTSRTRNFHTERTYSQAGFLQHLKECVTIPPNARWPDSLDSLPGSDKKDIGATCYREAYDELQSLDQKFIEEAKLLIISLQSSCHAEAPEIQ